MRKIYWFGILFIACFLPLLGMADNDDPSITINPTTALYFGNVAVGESRVTSFEVTGQNYTGTACASIEAPFEVSLDGVNFTDTVYFDVPGTMTMYLRFTPTYEGYVEALLKLFIPGNMGTSYYASGDGILCDHTIPYTTNFNYPYSNCWTIVDANNDGATFSFSDYYQSAQYYYSPTNPADDWLISPDFQLDGNQIGYLEYRVQQAYYAERFQVVALGDDTIPLSPVIETNNTAYQTLFFDLSSLNGSYRIGIHCISEADKYMLHISNFNILNIIPEVIIRPASILFPATAVLKHSTPATASLSTIGAISGPIILSVPEPFELSVDGITYNNTITLQKGDESIRTDTFLVRFSPTTFVSDTVQGMLTASYAGAQDSINMSGTVINCDNSIPYSYSFNDVETACWTVLNANNDNRTFQFSTSDSYATYSYHSTNPADDWLISPSFEFDGNQYGYFEYKTDYHYTERFQVFAMGPDTIPLSQVVDTNANSWAKQLLDLSVLNGSYEIGIHCTSDPNMFFLRITNFNIQPITPSISIVQDSLSFRITAVGESREPQRFIVAAVGISTPIEVSAPEQFEVSADGVTFSSSLTLPAPSTTVLFDTLYVRFVPTVAGSFSSPLTVSVSGLSDTIVVKGMSRDCNEAVSLPFEEGFEGDFNYCWAIVNQDGTGNTWTLNTSSTHSGSQSLKSTPTYLDYTAEYVVDNWLISPPIQLTDSALLSFYLRTATNLQNFSVYVSTTGPDIEDFTTEVYYNTHLFSTTTSYCQLSIPLYEFTGQTVRIAFRHHNSTSAMYLDDVTINTPQDHPTINVSNHCYLFSNLGIGMVNVKNVDVTGYGLTDSITATVAEPFSLSVDGTTYAQTVTLPSGGGLLYIRFAPTTASYHSKQLNLSSPGADDVNVLLDGRGIECYNTIPYTHLFNLRNSCWEVVDANGDNSTFDFQPYAPSYAYIYSVSEGDDWLISPTLPLDGNQYGFFEYGYATNFGKFQVFAIGADTVPLSDLVLVDNYRNFSGDGNKTFLFDLSTLSGPYRIGIHTIQEMSNSVLYFSNFNVLNITPILEFQADTLDFGEYTTNTGSNPTHPAVLAKIGINTPITLTATGSYEISLNGVDYSSSLTIPAGSTGRAYDTIFVRIILSDGMEPGGMLTATSGNLHDSVALLCNIIECPNSIPYAYSFNNEQYNKCWTVVNANDDNKTFIFNTSLGHAQYFYSATSNANDWLISPVFHLNGNQYGSFDYRSHSPYHTERFEVAAIGQEDTVLLVPPMEISNLYYQPLLFDLSNLNGDYQIGIHCLSDPDQYVFYVTNFKVEHFVPTLTVNQEQVDFGALVAHGISEMQQLVANGTGVFAPITITAPAGFEVSTDSVTFSSNVTIPAREYGFTTDTFYVRFNPAAEGVYDGLLTVSANNCADTVQLHGSIYYCEVPYPLPLIEDFEDALTSCWHITDYDGDGHSWQPTTQIPGAAGRESTNGYISLAYSGISYSIAQQNWLITPMFVPTENTVLAFSTLGTEGIPQQYNVYVAAENFEEAFMATTPVFSNTAEGTWEEYAISLADYAGDTVYVAFRHYGKNMGALTIDDIVITDNLDHPVVLTDASSVSFGTVNVGKSATRDVEITTFGLSGTMVATTTAPFTLSVDGTTFASFANIPASGGLLYIRYSPTSAGDDNGTVTMYIPGGQTRTIAVSGTGFDCLNTIPYSYQFDDSYISCWSVENSNGDLSTFVFDTVNGRVYYFYDDVNAADDWLLSPTFQFNGNQYGHFDYYCEADNYPERFEVMAIGVDTVVIAAPMLVNNTTPQTLNLDLTSLTGTYAIGIHCISDAYQYIFFIEDFNILNITPSLSVDKDSLAFEMIPLNSASDAQQIAISTIGVHTPITASVPLPFEISTDNITFGNTVVIPANSDLLGNDTLYVRFSPTSLNPAQNTLTLTSGNIQTVVTLTGTSRDCDAVLSLPIFESFEGASNYCWNFLDQDGDGLYWEIANTSHSHTGDQCAHSASYTLQTGALAPDNWLVSQPIQLPELPARLSFWIKEITAYYGHEYYSVYISTTGNSTTDFTDVLTSGYSTPSFVQQSVSLRDYAGQTVWIAFRHHNCSDVFQLVLDDIEIRLDTIPQLPMVVTDSVFSITQMSAVCIGHTVFDGNATITASGFVWGTSPNPTLADNVVNSTPGMPTMVGMLNGLSEHTTYYIRAFATNSIGTEYGEEIMFTTLCGPATYTNFSQSACESFTWNDSTYFESGYYTQQLTNMIGCDSIVTLHLTIHHGDTTEFAETACESFVWNNVTYNQSGDYTQTLTNIHGCDSVVTLHLTLYHAETAEFAETACDAFVWNDSIYTASGDYTQTLSNIHGCDSVVTLHLTLNHAETAEFAETACESFVWNDSVYTTSGDYTQTFANTHGCDSVVTLHLTLNHAETAEFAETACDAFVWNDSVYTVSGDYTQTFANVHGCDSVVTLHLTLNHAETAEFAETACDNFVWNGSVYTASGDYTQTFSNVHGCDSVVTLHLTLYSAVSNEETVSWPDSCYLWNGEEYCTSGDYTQTLTTVHGCDSTVTLHLTITVGVEDFTMGNDLRVYPNPTNGVLQISGTAFDEVQLFDAYGKLLGSWHSDGEITQIDLSRLAAGVYFVKALNRSQVVGVRKVLKR